MHHSPGLLALLDRASTAGPPRLAVPAAVPANLESLVRAPRAFDINAAGLADTITAPLRTLAALRDPVADQHAGWLLAVVLCASGIACEHDDSLPAGSDAGLTPEGRAWLVQQAMEAVATDAQRAGILAAVGA